MAKKHEEILDDVKDVLEDAKEVLEDVVDKAKPVVKKAAKKAAQAKDDATKAVKSTAKKVAAKKVEYFIQFNGNEISMEELANKAKAAFKADHKRAAVNSCRIYVKPEDNAAYYVINDTFFGRIEL